MTAGLTDADRLLRALLALQRRGVITTDPAEADTCCGVERDDDGLCVVRPRHPAYLPLLLPPWAFPDLVSP